MRELLRDYVYALNKAYLSHVAHLPPVERAALPLAGASAVTVAVAAGRELHLIATPETLPSPVGQEVELRDEYAGVSWSVRFYDATILPALGVVAPSADGSGDDPAAIRRVLGVADVVYHLSVSIGGGLTAHHAQHAGVALANQHAAAVRDRDALRHAFTGREELVEEFAVCERLGLVAAGGLLARAILGPPPGLPPAPGLGVPQDEARAAGMRELEAAIATGDLSAVRKVLLAHAPRGGGR